MEDQLGALGLLLNCIVLWNTVYMNAALEQLRVNVYDVDDEDGARLSPFIRRHLRVHGDYSFLLSDLAGALRELRDPTSPDYAPNDEDESENDDRTAMHYIHPGAGAAAVAEITGLLESLRTVRDRAWR